MGLRLNPPFAMRAYCAGQHLLEGVAAIGVGLAVLADRASDDLAAG